MTKSKINKFSFPIVQATHNQFISQAQNTFLLTWDGKINVQELSELLTPNPRSQGADIELLVLTACQTARL